MSAPDWESLGMRRHGTGWVVDAAVGYLGALAGGESDWEVILTSDERVDEWANLSESAAWTLCRDLLGGAA